MVRLVTPADDVIRPRVKTYFERAHNIIIILYETIAPRVSDQPLPIRLIGEISLVPPVAMIHVDLLLNFRSESAVVDPDAYPPSDRISVIITNNIIHEHNIYDV